MTAIEHVQEAWRLAASELGFQFTAPFEIKEAGCIVLFHGYVRDFGSPAGTVFFVCETFQERFSEAVNLARRTGYFYSQINAEVYRRFDRETFLEVLRDWGWFGANATRPNWL